MKAALFVCSVVASCMEGDAPALSQVAPTSKPPPAAPVFEADAPQLLTGSGYVRVVARPAVTARTIGYLQPRARVAHDPEPHYGYGCGGEWLAIEPRGFVCADGRSVRKAQRGTEREAEGETSLPLLDPSANLPYRYSRTTRSTALYEGAGGNALLVNRTGTLPPNSGLAVVAAVGAHDEKQGRRLALMVDGRYVDATALEATHPSAFRGVELRGRALPLGFVVATNASLYHLDGELAPRAESEIPRHRVLSLSGRRLRIDDTVYHHVRSGGWVSSEHVRVVSGRESFPPEVVDAMRWLDVDTGAGILVQYEGQEPLFATLVSVGEASSPGASPHRSTVRGWHRVVFKHVTGVDLEPSRFATEAVIYDIPWVMQLSSGQYLHGSYWHSRFGYPHGPGNLQLSPADARRLFEWSSPRRPKSWHAVAEPSGGEHTFVYVH